MASDVESITVMFDRARNAADVLRVLLEDTHRRAVLRQLIRGGETSRARAEDYDWIVERPQCSMRSRLAASHMKDNFVTCADTRAWPDFYGVRGVVASRV